VASSSWTQWFPDVKLLHLVSPRSDHCPVLLRLEDDQDIQPKQRLMCYEIMWERDDSLPGEVQRASEEGEPSHNLSDVATSLRRVMASLRRWSFDKFGGVNKELEAIRIKMEELCSQDHIANQVLVDQLKDMMDELLYREEMMWL
jgi:hypothetical protein